MSTRRDAPLVLGLLGVVLLAWAPVVAGARSVCHTDLFLEHVPFRAPRWSPRGN